MSLADITKVVKSLDTVEQKVEEAVKELASVSYLTVNKLSRYLELKQTAKSAETEIDEINSAIKKEIKNKGKKSFTSEYEDGDSLIKVVYIERPGKPSMNEEKLIAKLKELGFAELAVKTREYADSQVVEDLIYHNKLKPEHLSLCMNPDPPPVPTLTVKRVKVKKGGKKTSGKNK